MEHNIKIFTNGNEDGSHRGREKGERVRGGGEMGQNSVVRPALVIPCWVLSRTTCVLKHRLSTSHGSKTKSFC